MDHVVRSQEEWVLIRLERFYTNQESLKRVQNILEGKVDMSLRLIDWFVTNYSKKYNVSFITNNGKHVIVYLCYKSHLKAYSKKMFDPFCRWKRIKFHEFETTVGQLNFFEWAIQDEVLDYIGKHRQEIQDDMETRIHESKDLSIPKKRHEISSSATKSLKRHDIPVMVKFD